MKKTTTIIAMLLIVAVGAVFAADGVEVRGGDDFDGYDPSLPVPPPVPAFATGDTIFSEDWEWGRGFGSGT